ncbi:MAG: hybrid sensor histidine kinase/response regulator [Anaerolineae bacterium]|nr:MAG: hybrid sensor histidine kinase/response regulator [Anaerolineae bacterium]
MSDQAEMQTHASILVVDDNHANLRLLADMLLTHHYTVHEATSGPAALEIARTLQPDLILLDIAMPIMDGYQVCRALKADPRTCDIPIIFISALTETEDIVRGFEVGGVDYITRPFRFREVLARVASQITLVRQRREIEALRRQDRQTFESISRMKDEFIRMATHDLRNPLNVILGYTTVLEHIAVAEEHRPLMDEARQAIRSNVEKMRRLVTDMLELAQMETGEHLRPTEVSLSEFLAGAVSPFCRLAEQRDIALTYVPPMQDLVVMMDPDAMTRVMDNLLVNALNYTRPGGQVTVRARGWDSRALIVVADTGIGVPPEDLPHLFDAFYRVNRGHAADVDGSGLGLSIVKTIVERHGGHVRARSRVGVGSVFRISLPRLSG